MSQWHREHPELAGTDADPWMANKTHRRVTEQLIREGLIYVEAAELAREEEPEDDE